MPRKRKGRKAHRDGRDTHAPQGTALDARGSGAAWHAAGNPEGLETAAAPDGTTVYSPGRKDGEVQPGAPAGIHPTGTGPSARAKAAGDGAACAGCALPGCGKLFRKVKPWQKFCSARCRRRHFYLRRLRKRPLRLAGTPVDASKRMRTRVYSRRRIEPGRIRRALELLADQGSPFLVVLGQRAAAAQSRHKEQD